VDHRQNLEPVTFETSTTHRVSLAGSPVMSGRRFDPVRVLGCSPHEALRLFRGRAVTPGEAEAIAKQSYPWRRHLHDSDSYWITTAEAARILHESPHQVKRLLNHGQLPHVRHASGVRLMRREQIAALAARRSPTNR